TVATNLALAFAQDERDVVLVDADLRRPQAAMRLGCDADSGLGAVLVGERTTEEALVEVDASGGRLRVLPAGLPPPNPAVLLGSRRMRSLLEDLAIEADIVVIDTPAMLAVSDAIPLLEQVAGTVLVARIGRTTRQSLVKTRQVVAAAGGVVLGVVATGARAGGLYGYDEGAYAYYATSSS
ncbi:MAG TPA: CpsD/CapB family tyrosine-protein kinase, partial [Solirubrobacterales bacterium]|nr:CpsD/CapB family tyrosine-protein kinase [Solirubrobacterales bacterium]